MPFARLRKRLSEKPLPSGSGGVTGRVKRVTSTSHVRLLTAVSARKDAGSSPTGIVGRRLARQLLDADDRVRVLAEPGLLDGWPDGAEVVEGSITRPLERPEVFDGVDGVFLAGAVPATVRDALEVARRAGVRRIVVLSSHGPEYEEAYPPETWFWLAIERAVERSGMEWTHIRPSAVMGAMIEGTYPATGSDWPDTIKGERIVREAFVDGGHYPFIHEDDLAAVAVAALRADAHVGAVLEAVGLPISTRSRVAGIAEAMGCDIAAVELTPDESRANWRRRGWPDSGIDVTLYALRSTALGSPSSPGGRSTSGRPCASSSAARCAASTTGRRSMPVCSTEGAMTGGRPSSAGRPRARTAPAPLGVGRGEVV